MGAAGPTPPIEGVGTMSVVHGLAPPRDDPSRTPGYYQYLNKNFIFYAKAPAGSRGGATGRHVEVPPRRQARRDPGPTSGAVPPATPSGG
jgi:hypothetical protein